MTDPIIGNVADIRVTVTAEADSDIGRVRWDCAFGGESTQGNQEVDMERDGRYTGLADTLTMLLENLRTLG